MQMPRLVHSVDMMNISIRGIDADYETIYQDIIARDYQDSHRKISPLKKADDAIEIDTSHLTIDEVVDAVLNIINKEI